MKALVTGATGLVGRELVRRLAEAVVLTRDVASGQRRLGEHVRALAWQPETEAAPAAAFEGVDVVFHLAGEPVAEGRWISGHRRVYVSEARIVDASGEECARGTGTFLRSHIALTSLAGYSAA